MDLKSWLNEKQIKYNGTGYEKTQKLNLSTQEMHRLNVELFRQYAIDKEKIQSGLMKKSDSEARKALIEQNLRLVQFVYSNQFNRCIELKHDEDFLQAGTIGLIKAIDNYDIDKAENSAPSTYMCKCIYRAIWREYTKDQKMNRHWGVVSLENEVIKNKCTNYENQYLESIMVSDFNLEEYVLENLESKADEVRNIIKQLPEKERQVVYLTLYKINQELHGNHIPYKVLEAKLPITHQRIHQTRTSAFEHMRILLTPEDKRNLKEQRSIYLMEKQVARETQKMEESSNTPSLDNNVTSADNNTANKDASCTNDETAFLGKCAEHIKVYLSDKSKSITKQASTDTPPLSNGGADSEDSIQIEF